MTAWEAPAKINLSLQVRPPDRTGLHPLRSLCQTVERLDVLTVSTGEDERLTILGDDPLPEGEDNLVWKAVRCLVGRPDRPRLELRLDKHIPAAAGLGGGSSDAAAALLGAAAVYGRPADEVQDCAPQVGADVAYMLVGGSMWMEGHGEELTAVEPLTGFCVAVAVPPVEISTRAAYTRWDALGGPAGPEIDGRHLPTGLRQYGPLRNDLTPAAFSLAPELADWAADLTGRWGRPVAMTGSGSAHFGFFSDLDEATAACDAVPDARTVFGAALRETGVTAR